MTYEKAGRRTTADGRSRMQQPALDLTAFAFRSAPPNTLRHLAISSGTPIALFRFSERFTAALFWPDLARNPVQGRHLGHYWNGELVDLYSEAGTGKVFRIVPSTGIGTGT